MIRDICKDEAFLAQKAQSATLDDLSVGQDLLDTLAHLGEIGSLFAPTSDDVAALEGDLRESMADDIFAAKANENVETALSLCKALNRRFDVVVANPPYMGTSSFGPFMSRWVKKNYPDVKSDLCTCFIERGFSLARDHGYAAMITMQSWMFVFHNN